MPGLPYGLNEVLSYDIPNVHSGLLRSVAEPLARAGINLQYFYAFVQSEAGKATVVLKVDNLNRAEEVLKRC
jgi:hypothetical protein